MPIHETSLIRPENLRQHDSLEIDGVDVSGSWSTFIESRIVNDYNEKLETEVAAFPGGALSIGAGSAVPVPIPAQ